ncbi:unnamed protein product, partial [Strongylus vulgaris]
MNAVETSKNVAIQGGTVGLGAAVVATQIGLALSAGGANLILNTIGGAQNAGQRLLASVREAEKMMEEKIWGAIAEGQRVAQIPVDKLAESTNAFLDVISVLVERSLGVTVEEVPESSVKDRVSRLARKIVEALSNKVFLLVLYRLNTVSHVVVQAHTHVIDPVNVQLHTLLEQLRKSFILADLVREKREWALEKVGELSASVSDVKTRIENEAKLYKAKPEELLMKSIRNTSIQLRNNLQQLKNNGQK